MRKKFKNIGILACLAILFLFVSDAFAPWKYNPFTRKLDYYSMDVGAGLVGEAAGDVLYYNGTNWTNLARANNTDVLTLVAGLPAWVAAGAPGAHAATHEVGGGDLVDHDQLTNYLAGQHLALPSTIVATLTDHNLAAHTALGLNDMANVFYVSATGGDYATIQAALTAQAVVGATFVVGTGVYANDTVHFTANAQTVIGVGRGINSSVTQADANIVDASTFTDCRVVDMAIRLTAPTTAINAIQVDTGSLGIIDCRVYLATAVALVQVNQPSLVGFTDAGTIVLKGGLYEYYHTGACGGTAIKAAFRANIDLCLLHLHKIDLVEITNSGTALATALFVSTGTAVVEMHNCVDVIVTDPNATNVVGMGYTGGAGVHNLQGNHIDVVATNNTSYGIYHDGTATIRAAFNAIHASDVAGSSYAFFVGVTAALTSHFDDLRSGDGNTINGTLYIVSSEIDGDQTISGTLTTANIAGAAIGSDVQAWDTDLDTYAGITPSANVQTLLANASFALFMADLSGTAGAAFAWNGQNITGLNSIYLVEQADADADIGGSGQIWVDADNPNTLWFTDEDGTDVQLGATSTFKLKVDAGATEDYFGVAGGDGLFRFTLNHFTMADGGNFVTFSLADHATARQALGLEIAVDVQGYNAVLAELTALTDPGADEFPFWNDTTNDFEFSTVLFPTATGVNVGAAGNAAKLEFEDATGDVFSLSIGVQAGNTDYVWPTAFGTTGFVLSSTDAGLMTWVANAGGGTLTTIKENNVGVGDADIVVLDFLGADFIIAEAPDTEIQVSLDYPNAQKATTGQAGFLTELTTTAEVNAGIDTTRAVTADALAGSTLGRKSMIWKLTANDEVIVDQDDYDSILVPADFAGWLITGVAARIVTADDGADFIDVGIYNVTQTAEILSTLMRIEAGEFSTLTSVQPGAIDGAEDDITAADVIRIDIDYGGDNCTGLEVHITFEKVT